jgi:hypothetical protein
MTPPLDGSVVLLNDVIQLLPVADEYVHPFWIFTSQQSEASVANLGDFDVHLPMR